MGNPAHLQSRHLGPGDKLGKYELIRQIAVGGMAELYLARTVGIEGFEKLVVVKRILPQYVASASFVEMFLNEARLAATLHHPNVAQVYDIGLDHGDYFFAMEYVHGEDLHRIASVANEQGVPISMDAALTLAAGLCAGLHYAHEKAGPDGKPLQIVHRDVSPSNVLVSYDGAVKLVDFGIARAATRQTTTTGLKGKLSYMSPEQGKSHASLDRRSDIYSVGAVLYELTTGRLPFEGDSEYEILRQVIDVDAPPPSRFVPAYPPQLEQIVLRALARDPERRYANAQLLQGDLEDFAHDNRLRVSPLVLGRLMETLFPERLEEWAHAKAQGAFFVEQHVVRTLIESGKTPDPEEQKRRIAEAEAARERPPAPPGDEDTTSVSAPVPPDLSADTAIGPPPIIPEDSGRVPEPVPGSGYPVAPPRQPTPPPVAPRIATPPPGALRIPTPVPAPLVPGMPGAVPIVPVRASSPQIATPVPAAAPPGVTAIAPVNSGTLYSSSTSYAPPSYPPGALPAAPAYPSVATSQIDVTEKVRLPRAPSPTSHVRAPRRRTPLLVFVVLVIVAGGIAAVIALHGGAPSPAPAAAPAPSTPPADEAPHPATTVVPAPAAAPAPPEPAASEPTPPTPPPAAATSTAAAPSSPAPAPAAPPRLAPAHSAVHHVVHAPARPHVRPAEPKPKEKPWSADSPFMPVRNDGH